MKERKTTSGSADEAKGRIRSAYGELTGDEEQRRKGKVEKAEGKAKGLIDRASDAVKRGLDRRR